MSKFAIERNGNLVLEVILLGDSDKNLYRQRDIRIMTFETEKQVNEMLSIWENAKLIDYEEYTATKQVA